MPSASGQGGSSPLARGTPEKPFEVLEKNGLIPARAGNTIRSSRLGTISRAHPRSRGEHPRKEAARILPVGSSPLARGTPRPTPERVGFFGLIPARAGNTLIIAHLPSRTGAHPRSRGEHCMMCPFTLNRAGSSPLARGTQTRRSRYRPAYGLIPARAGNTCVVPLSPTNQWAHPRSRGEHIKGIIDGVVQWGSSPLARGTPCKLTHRVHASGLIPARAGNTSVSFSVVSVIRAHPRSRGEHVTAICILVMAPGSSPLARGTRGR